MPRNCKCPHLDNNILQLSLSELCRQKQGVPCTQCDVSGPNLWICLTKNCLHIGCSEHYNDHSTIHFKHNPSHCIHMNQSSQRIWCYKCEMEVFIMHHGYSDNKRRQTIDSDEHLNSEISRIISRSDFGYGTAAAAAASMNGTNGDNFDSSADDEADPEQNFYTSCSGLVGLQNIANTCYMNAALQALSNTPPLTGYFLECGNIIEANYEMAAPTSSQRKTGLARGYYRLVKDMWLGQKRKNGYASNASKFGYVVPNGILYAIRNVHPMFRGFQQHDTQEFLRCFMDQLHEELKEVTPPPPDLLLTNKQTNSTTSISSYMQSANSLLHLGSTDDDHSGCSTPSLSQSEAEYETCDSGVSEQSSLSDEMTTSVHRMIPNSINAVKIQTNQIQKQSPHTMTSASSSYSRSPSPTASQRTFKSTHSSMKSNRSNSITSLNSLQMSGGGGGGGAGVSVSGSVGSGSQQSHAVQSDSEQTEKSDSTISKLPHRSIISDVFDGKLLSSVQCLTCDRVSTREETFQDLSLPIPGKDHLNVLHQTQGFVSPLPTGLSSDTVYQVGHDGWMWWLWHWVRSFFWGPAVTLHDCMSAFFSADELKGDNMYSCEKCNKLRNGMKFSRVLELPEMLCVHLKRFRHDLSYSSKISSPVNFPLVGLDMRPYLHKECKSKVSTYDLTAVICHHGHVGGGHYTSFAKHELSGKWFEFDDQIVNEVSPEVVQNCEAYVLFYRKSNPQMSLIRDQAVQIEERITEQTSGIRFFVSRQWLNRFKTFAEPGPIDNWTLLCAHGGLSPRKARIASQLVVPLPQALWDYLFEKFGGGPACNHLFECEICAQQADALARRKNYELDEFSACKDELTSTIYAISMHWFRQWQNFVGNVNEEIPIPGPINNSSIALQTDSNGIARGVRPGSDYAQINSTLWKFFYSIYGGGPIVVLRGNMEEITRATLPITPNPINRERDERNSIDCTTANNDSMPINTTTTNTNTNTNNNNNASISGKDGTSLAASQNSSIINMSNASNTVDNSTLKSITHSNGNDGNMMARVSSSFNQILSNQTTIAKKATKNVSFEDDDSNSSDRESNNAIEQSFYYIRRGKHHYSTSPTLAPGEILSKKDRRLRSSIKANGFFGLEGKYTSNNPHQDEGMLNGSQNLASTTETNKKLEEITPLFNHQATISSSNSIDNGSEPNANANGINGRNGAHKVNHRKRVKTKSSRKT